jgi:hypothetical protein
MIFLVSSNYGSFHALFLDPTVPVKLMLMLPWVFLPFWRLSRSAETRADSTRFDDGTVADRFHSFFSVLTS